MTLPTYDELPIDPKYPPHTAWGLWGENDNLGTLNLLTEERVKKASQYIKKGQVFPLNWKLESPSPPLFGRGAVHHTVIPHTKENLSFDDQYDNFNPQSSTQWDGLKHIAHFSAGKFYNNVSYDEIASSDRLGIQNMARRGIAGRAVLLDFARWAKVHRPSFNPLERQEITVEELDQVAAEQGVEFEEGDILLVRIGWMAAYEKEGDRLHELMDLKHPSCAGVKACQDTFRWIWNHHFAAVACDNFPFEAFPPEDWVTSCHAMFLGGWGMPIGEMFDLEKLAEASAQDKNYIYFFTSAPLNKSAGVASPPNALCIN